MKIKRAFIPLAFAGFTIPFIISDLTTLTSVGLCYFWSSYIILWNFPQINSSLYSEPLYVILLEILSHNIVSVHLATVYERNISSSCLLP